ncbi:MAG: ribonuclease P protein component [Phycisphaerales bacterium]|nr:ribonuclease P protein component [Phycisphaerales bacterium]
MAFGFNKSRRLLSSQQFELVYKEGTSLYRGPVRVHVMANGLEHDRLGLSIPKHSGNAVRRNRFKRLLREAFRLMPEHDRNGYDLVVTIRAHKAYSRNEYQTLLDRAIQKAACRT